MSYITHKQDDEFDFPTDDGTGKAVGQLIPANQAGFLQIHFINPTGTDAPAHVAIEATGYGSTSVTEAAPFVTYNTMISIPAQSVADVTQTCNTPAGATFLSLAMYTHKYSTDTHIRDGVTSVYDDSDWSNPQVLRFGTPFLSFSTDQLTFECDYNNVTNATIVSGDNVAINEQCMAFGFYVPSVGPQFCLDGVLVSPPVALEGRASGIRDQGSGSRD